MENLLNQCNQPNLNGGCDLKSVRFATAAQQWSVRNCYKEMPVWCRWFFLFFFYTILSFRASLFSFSNPQIALPPPPRAHLWGSVSGCGVSGQAIGVKVRRTSLSWWENAECINAPRCAAWRLSHNLSEVIMHRRDEEFGLSAQADQTISLFCRFHGYSLNRKRQKLCIFIHKELCPGMYPWARGNQTLRVKVSSLMEKMFYPSYSTGEFLQPPVASPELQEGG